jgi:hypothetical protein
MLYGSRQYASCGAAIAHYARKTRYCQTTRDAATKNKEYRHDLLNGILLCHDHHVPFAHAYPDAFTRWLKERWPTHYKWFMAHKNLPAGRVPMYRLEETIEELNGFIWARKNKQEARFESQHQTR